MSDLQIIRQHNMSQNECQEIAKKLLEKLTAQFGGQFELSNNAYRYRHPMGVNAHLESRPSELTVCVKLGLMTRAMAPKMEQEINRVLDEYLTV